MKPKGNSNHAYNRENEDYPAYPRYGKDEDIYRNADEIKSIDPDKIEKKKGSQGMSRNEKNVMAGEFIEGSNQPGSQKPPSDSITDDEDDDDDLDMDDDDMDDDTSLDDDDDDEEILSAVDEALGAPEKGHDGGKHPNRTDKAISSGHRDGEELDVPGAELDDDQEELGSEDEENNYYSLGGDNHEA